jgi:hypothetical protein
VGAIVHFATAALVPLVLAPALLAVGSDVAITAGILLSAVLVTVLPALIGAILWSMVSLTPVVAVVEERGALDALARGWALSKGRRLAFVLALGVIAIGVDYAGDGVARLLRTPLASGKGALVEASLLPSLARLAVETVLAGLVALVPAVLYRMIRELGGLESANDPKDRPSGEGG